MHAHTHTCTHTHVYTYTHTHTRMTSCIPGLAGAPLGGSLLWLRLTPPPEKVVQAQMISVLLEDMAPKVPVWSPCKAQPTVSSVLPYLPSLLTSCVS